MQEQVVMGAKKRLAGLEDWHAKGIADSVTALGQELDQPSKVIMQILRYSLAGLEPGVGIPVIIEILGRDRALRRLEDSLAY